MQYTLKKRASDNLPTGNRTMQSEAPSIAEAENYVPAAKSNFDATSHPSELPVAQPDQAKDLVRDPSHPQEKVYGDAEKLIRAAAFMK